MNPDSRQPPMNTAADTPTPQDGDRELAFDYGVRTDETIWATYGTFPGTGRHCAGDINLPLWAVADLKRRLNASAAVERETAINRDVLHNNTVEINGYKEENCDLRAKLTAAEGTVAQLRTRLDTAREALEELKSDEQVTIDQYERNGPTWTSKEGAQYYDASFVIEGANENITKIESALASLREGEKPATREETL
jgi:hypothetical protein